MSGSRNSSSVIGGSGGSPPLEFVTMSPPASGETPSACSALTGPVPGRPRRASVAGDPPGAYDAPPMSEPRHVTVLILGAGPAGYTAALYTSRAELAPLML